MKVVNLFLCGLLLSFLSAASAESRFSYPRSLKPPSTLFVYSDSSLGSEDGLIVTLLTLGGGLARTQPMFYRVPTGYPGADSYNLWLSRMEERCNVQADLSFLDDAFGLLTKFKSKISGYVLYNSTDNSVNAALTFVAGQKADELLVAAASSSSNTLSLLRSLRVPMVYDASGTREAQAYLARGAGAFSGKMVSFQHPHLFSNLAEYAVFGNMPTLEYSTDTDKYPNGGPYVKQVIKDMGEEPSISAAIGWGPEYQYVSNLGNHGIFVHASDMAHNVAAIANAACPPPTALPAPTPKPRAASPDKHRVAFLMTDGDNVQWLFNTFVTDPQWWGNRLRGKEVPIGWTLSPGLYELGMPILDYLRTNRTELDDFIGAPSGLGYVYPSSWTDQTKFESLAKKTGYYLNKTMSRLGGGSSGIVNVIGEGNEPKLSTVAPLLRQESIKGIFWYTFGAGYSGWSGTKWDADSGKPIVGARVSLWGNSTRGTMIGVGAMVERFKELYRSQAINGNRKSTDGYSLVPVNVWSHSVADVVAVAQGLEKLGNFEIVTPSALLEGVAKYCGPGRHHTS